MFRKTFYYKTIHLPTGACFVSNTSKSQLPIYQPHTVKDFHDMLCRWNAQQPDIWLYAPINKEDTQ